MPSRVRRRGAGLVAASLMMTVFACDAEEADQSPTEQRSRSAEPIELPEAGPEMMEYEDAEDFAILHDSSNLRPPDMPELDYQRSLQQDARDELQRAFPEISYPTQADVELLSMRWFVQGSGVIVQNVSTRSFGVTAHFDSAEDPACRASVPSKPIGPAASAMFVPADMGCEFTHATLTVNDEYGFLVDSVTVAASEELR